MACDRGFQKFGFSALEGTDANTEEFETRAHSPYTDVLVSSEGIIPEYMEAFRKQANQIKPIGVPRTDVFLIKNMWHIQKKNI